MKDSERQNAMLRCTEEFGCLLESIEVVLRRSGVPGCSSEALKEKSLVQ